MQHVYIKNFFLSQLGFWPPRPLGYATAITMGGDLGGLSPKIWGGGTAHASAPPNILRTTAIGCEAKYKLTNKRGGILGGEIEVSVNKGKLLLYLRFQTAETEKVEWMKFGPQKFFPSPPNSVPSLRPWR